MQVFLNKHKENISENDTLSLVKAIESMENCFYNLTVKEEYGILGEVMENMGDYNYYHKSTGVIKRLSRKGF